MANRRPLGAAMNLSEDKLAFIKGAATVASPAILEAPISEGAKLDQEPVRPELDGLGTSAADVETDRTASRSHRVRNRTTGTKAPNLETRSVTEDFYGQILVPLTTRLKAPTADALRRACLEQKLSRRVPNTQQEIVEIALIAWLREHAYL